MKWICKHCLKYQDDPKPCTLERDTTTEMNISTECPFYGDLECEWEVIDDVGLSTQDI